MQTKAYDKAIADLDRVVKLDRHNAQDYYQRGLAREATGDLEAADLDYKTALRRDRKFHPARQALTRVGVALYVEELKRAEQEKEAAANAAKASASAGGDTSVAARVEGIVLPPVKPASLSRRASDSRTAWAPLPRPRPESVGAERVTQDREARPSEQREDAKRQDERQAEHQAEHRAAPRRAAARKSSTPRPRYDDRAETGVRREMLFTDIWNDRR
jgi:tetratricopeptide (TPR) repeat protein